MKKDKLEQSRNHLVNSIRSLPDSFNLSSVKAYLYKALTEMDHVEKKTKIRTSQETTSNQWKFDPIQGAIMNPMVAAQKLKEINKLIEAEKEKLNKQNDQPEDLEDQTLMG